MAPALVREASATGPLGSPCMPYFNMGPRGDYNNSLLLLRDPGGQRNFTVNYWLWDLVVGEKRGWQID